MDNFWWPSLVEAKDGNLRVRDSAQMGSESMDENPSQCPVCEGPMKDWQSVPQAPILSEPVAVLRYDRSSGNENEMPKVVSCNWLPDGEYEVFLKR